MLEEMGKAARAAAYTVADLSTAEKNQVLMTIADRLEAESADILAANELDLADARQNGMSAALLDRLTLNPQRLGSIASDVRQVCQLADPVGQLIDGGQLDSG
ncbi:gamma-glutamyl-phosphate reductase, partial [Pantoea agglomerans]